MYAGSDANSTLILLYYIYIIYHIIFNILHITWNEWIKSQQYHCDPEFSINWLISYNSSLDNIYNHAKNAQNNMTLSTVTYRDL